MSDDGKPEGPSPELARQFSDSLQNWDAIVGHKLGATDLKPCPFCGGAAVLKQGEDCAIAQCIEVSAHRLIVDGDNNAAEEVTKLWNQRPGTNSI